MIDILSDLSNFQLVLVLVGAFTGLIQLALLLSLVIRGGVVSIWWGIITILCTIALVFTR